MSFHWKVLVWMLAGVLVGLVMQWTLNAPAWGGVTFETREGDPGVVVSSLEKKGPGEKAKLAKGDEFVAAVLDRGSDDERTIPLNTAADWHGVSTGDTQAEPGGILAELSNGEVVWLAREVEAGEDPLMDAVPVAVGLAGPGVVL